MALLETTGRLVAILHHTCLSTLSNTKPNRNEPCCTFKKFNHSCQKNHQIDDSFPRYEQLKSCSIHYLCRPVAEADTFPK